MGTNSLPKIAAAPVKVPATSTQYNDVVDALQGHLVMRDSDGIVEDNVSEIGRPSSGRPKKIHIGEAITIGGQTLNTAPFLLSRTGIQSGLAKASGFPQFLEPGDETGTGGSHIVRILAAATPLEMTIDGQAYSLETDLESDDLALAPSANNTCLVDDINIAADPEWSKTIGEFGYWISIDTIGSEIEALTGTIQCFKVNNGSETEVFIAEIEADNTGSEVNRLIPILRGIGGTNRIAFTDNDTITLLKAHYIFLDNDLATINTTINYPTWSATEPVAPTTGDYWWDVTNKTWKRYSGATWETLGRIYLGYAIADLAGIEWVEHVDFNLEWDNLLSYDRLETMDTENVKLFGNINVNVAGNKIITRNITLNTNTDFESGQSIGTQLSPYIYCDLNGIFYLSNTAPRIIDDKLGWYHPKQYWRCIGLVIIKNSQIVNFVYNPMTGILDIAHNNLLFTALDGTNLLFLSGVPAIIKQLNIRTYISHVDDSTTGTLYIESYDINAINQYLFLGRAFSSTYLTEYFWSSRGLFRTSIIKTYRENLNGAIIYVEGMILNLK